jgi:hypothetical protein
MKCHFLLLPFYFCLGSFALALFPFSLALLPFSLALLPWLFSLWISTLKFIMDEIARVGKRYNLGLILLKV